MDSVQLESDGAFAGTNSVAENIMEHFEVISALREVVGIPDLGDEALETLCNLANSEEYSEGTVLFSEGDSHNRVYFVCEGSVSLDMLTASCGNQTILTAGKGDLLAWSALVGNGVMTSTAMVKEDAKAIAFSASALRQALAENHELGYKMMLVVAKALSNRLVATRLQLLDLYH